MTAATVVRSGDPQFLACLPFTLAQEAPFPNDWSNPKNYSDDAHDSGGPTYMGITQAEYDRYRLSKGQHTQGIRNIGQVEGEDIYLNSYWLPVCATCPPGLNLSVFDARVNMGVEEATKLLQVALRLTEDGVWGPKTAAAVAGLKDIPAAIQAFTARREAVYREMEDFKYFGSDWIKRALEIGQESTKMAESALAVA